MKNLFIGLILFATCNSMALANNIAEKMSTDSENILLVNHLGYEPGQAKKAIFQTAAQTPPESYQILDDTGNTVYEGRFHEGGAIANWHTGNAFPADFTELDRPGEYKIVTQYDGVRHESLPFTIEEQVIAKNTLQVLVEGVNSQRTADEFNETDKNMTFFGERQDTIDVSGGWYDASGDRGKYLSHLSYANFMNPQQAPMVVWNFLQARKNAGRYQGDNADVLKEMLVDEATHGADWLIRMQDPEGYFYINVFANWSWIPEQREISAYIGQEGFKNKYYQAGYREGGGMSIAALARMYAEGYSGEFSPYEYLEAAMKGFDHLEVHNRKHIWDGQENMIDDYTALMAATELYNATSVQKYLDAARARMQNLTNRLTDDDNMQSYWRADDADERPFFHAAEAGLPMVALVRYLELEKDDSYRNQAIASIQRSVDFELAVTNEVNNPFGYARQYVKGVNENQKRTSFFIPQNNETGYWWQGENARLASLAAAMHKAAPYLKDSQVEQASAYAADQLNWILGLNPYNMTMLHGRGYNNPSYAPSYSNYEELNVTGCVLNGITAGFGEEDDIAFRPHPYGDDVSHMWRWSEQWLQHGSWLLLAISESL